MQRDAFAGVQRLTDRRKKDAIRDEILARLVTGQYRFGERILVKELSGETGVSRQPIMAALSDLQSDGFVTIIAQVGCQVVSPAMQEIADFYVVFSRLEGVMAEFAARRRDPAELAELETLNGQITALPPVAQSGEPYRRLNIAFHRTIHAMARSEVLHGRQQANWCMSDFLIIQSYGFVPHLDGAAREHAEIIAAIAAADARRAREAAEAHILSVGQLVRQAIEKRMTVPSAASRRVLPVPG